MNANKEINRPKLASEALELIKQGTDIEIENRYAFDLMRYVEAKERNISFRCRVNHVNQGWTLITGIYSRNNP